MIMFYLKVYQLLNWESSGILGIKRAQTTLGRLSEMPLFSIFFFIIFTLISSLKGNCDSEIYCRGPILEKIQMSGLFADSKQFVDMPTSKSKAVVNKT